MKKRIVGFQTIITGAIPDPFAEGWLFSFDNANQIELKTIYCKAAANNGTSTPLPDLTGSARISISGQSIYRNLINADYQGSLYAFPNQPESLNVDINMKREYRLTNGIIIPQRATMVFDLLLDIPAGTSDIFITTYFGIRDVNPIS